MNETVASEEAVSASVDSLVAPSAERPSVAKALLHAREAMMRQLRPTLRQYGLTEQQWRVLGELLNAEETSASDLAAATCLRASSLSRIIKDLEARDYLRRRSQMEDLRRTLVSITPRGRNVMQHLRPFTIEIHTGIVERFGEASLGELLTLSSGLVSALGVSRHGADDDGE